MAEANDFNPADLPLFPPTDETGDVDLTLVEYYLRLTPAERLACLDAFESFVDFVRKNNGVSNDSDSGVAQAAS